MKARFGLPLALLFTLVLLAPLAGCGSDAATQDHASADEQAVIDECLATFTNDPQGQVALWTKDAVFEDYMSNVTTAGRDQILDYLAKQATQGAHFEVSAEAIKLGDYIVQPTVAILEDGSTLGHGVQVFELTGDNLIKHLWISGAEDRYSP
jgi:hypothetical protein